MLQYIHKNEHKLSNDKGKSAEKQRRKAIGHFKVAAGYQRRVFLFYQLIIARQIFILS